MSATSIERMKVYHATKKLHCSIRRLHQRAENGNAEAQYQLGMRYYHGIMVAQDYATAVYWLRQSDINRPYSDAAYQLGICFEEGHGLIRNMETAFRIYRRLVQHNYSLACIRLSHCYLQGIGTPMDKEMAETLERKFLGLQSNFMERRQEYPKKIKMEKDLMCTESLETSEELVCSSLLSLSRK